jgi:hypothetical protein
MFNISLTEEEFRQLPCYAKWWNDMSIEDHFHEWLPKYYPEVISVKWHESDRIFTFESEEHYNWFLLKQ